ncbi:MAG: O-succinylbenzoic acid--CoA ligase, partial [Cyclobacteriaceae bacterium]|nr:O-succinylbenzoic acid--CoA ligase [Cyclobacteriaceae bacterium]
KAKVFQSYAMTETLTHVALRKVNGKEKSDIYHALQGVSFSQDTRECLIIHDRILGIEHLITNDVVELVGKKSFRWIGRYDNVINSGGIKIHIEGVENEIHGIFDDMQIQNTFCLLSIPDRKFTNKMILLIEQNESLINEDIILATLKRKLPKYHDPKSVKQVSELILTKSGKIDRKRNTELYLST